jgi:Leucine-rich repeat (LRR) protein
MKEILTSLKAIQAQHRLDECSDDELRELKQLMDALAKEARNLLAERAIATNNDPHYIEVVINGQPDRIKRDIETLNISCNSFTRLPEAIYELKKLKKLYLFNNQFSDDEKRAIRRRMPAHTRLYF